MSESSSNFVLALFSGTFTLLVQAIAIIVITGMLQKKVVRLTNAGKEKDAQADRLMQHSPYPVIVAQDATIVSLNIEALHVHGGARTDEFVGKPLERYFGNRIGEALARIGRTERDIVNFTDNLEGKDGTLIRMGFTAIPITVDGEPGMEILLKPSVRD